ncbi:MAG: hypothetical protein NEA02_14455 [Thermoanaerobaculia bacterium]|nr:hypothetical protein [Thermoanaerobaculia bacterium]
MKQPVGKEVRSVVNALFLFALFLLVYSALVPGHARGSVRGPRFLRMQVDDLRHDRHRVSFSVPYAFVSGALRFASLGKVRREMDLHFDRSVDASDIRTIVQELKDKPDGTDIVRTHDDAEIHVRKDGDQVTLEVQKPGRPEETVILRLPWRIVDAVSTADRNLDVDALVAQLRNAERGDLVEISAPDAHVRIWID